MAAEGWHVLRFPWKGAFSRMWIQRDYLKTVACEHFCRVTILGKSRACDHQRSWTGWQGGAEKVTSVWLASLLGKKDWTLYPNANLSPPPPHHEHGRISVRSWWPIVPHEPLERRDSLLAYNINRVVEARAGLARNIFLETPLIPIKTSPRGHGHDPCI